MIFAKSRKNIETRNIIQHLNQKCKVFMKKNPIEGLVKYDECGILLRLLKKRRFYKKP